MDNRKLRPVSIEYMCVHASKPSHDWAHAQPFSLTALLSACLLARSFCFQDKRLDGLAKTPPVPAPLFTLVRACVRPCSQDKRLHGLAERISAGGGSILRALIFCGKGWIRHGSMVTFSFSGFRFGVRSGSRSGSVSVLHLFPEDVFWT